MQFSEVFRAHRRLAQLRCLDGWAGAGQGHAAGLPLFSELLLVCFLKFRACCGSIVLQMFAVNSLEKGQTGANIRIPTVLAATGLLPIQTIMACH